MKIYFVTTRSHRYTIERHLQAYGRSLRQTVQPITYAAFQSKRDIAVYVLADIERLSARQIRLAERAAERLISGGALVLNRPSLVKTRFELLTALTNAGLNSFRTCRVSNCNTTTLNYPVFLRCCNDHKGARSDLIHNETDLKTSIAQQSRTRVCFIDEHGKWRPVRLGYRRRRQLLVTEFCNTADSQGMYRKYSAFCVGGKIIARHLFFGSQWMLKSPKSLKPEQLEEERKYVNDNPHTAQISEAFRHGCIDYGRIDYACLNGQVQTWEINTNPMITSPRDELLPERHEVHCLFSSRFEDALRSLSTEDRQDSSNVSAVSFEPDAATRDR